MIEKKQTNKVSAAPWMKPSLVSLNPAMAGNRSMMISYFRPKLRKNEMKRTSSVAQTAITRSSKPMVAPRGKTGGGTMRSPIFPSTIGSSLSGSLNRLHLLAGDVGADPLLGDRLQGAVGFHGLEDLLDLGLPFRIALVD